MKYPKNIWTKVLILAVIILTLFVYIDIKVREKEKLIMEKFYTQYCMDYSFAVLNVQYQDSIFRVVVKDELDYLKEKYHEKLQNALKQECKNNPAPQTVKIYKSKGANVLNNKKND